MGSITIPVNLADVEAYKDLDDGTYLCEIQKVVHQEPKVEGKFPQLRIHYAVIDGEQLGERTTEWVSLSPAAAFRLKQWFMKFGIEDLENLEIDEDSNELIVPDLQGTRVIVKVAPDAKAPGGRRTQLVSVEDDDIPGVTAPQEAAQPAAAAPRVARPAAAPAAPARRSLR